MLARMPSPPSNSSPGLNYWYGSNSLPDALDGAPQDSSNARNMRRASEAVVQATGFQSRPWFHGPVVSASEYRMTSTMERRHTDQQAERPWTHPFGATQDNYTTAKPPPNRRQTAILHCTIVGTRLCEPLEP
ncbi:hypothetical protein NX059_006376 [Plenodomus lindquistii]|nr:hypothetical protein NX059_006376 [Plenodomus lindquistii]